MQNSKQEFRKIFKIRRKKIALIKLVFFRTKREALLFIRKIS